MRYPSVKTLQRICPDNARLLRQILEGADQLRGDCSYGLLAADDTLTEHYRKHFPKTHAWCKSLYSDPWKTQLKLQLANELLGTYGVEHIQHLRSPAISYCNVGDPYTDTLLYISGEAMPWRVGCWGAYVERGNYP